MDVTSSDTMLSKYCGGALWVEWQETTKVKLMLNTFHKLNNLTEEGEVDDNKLNMEALKKREVMSHLLWGSGGKPGENRKQWAQHVT